MGEVVARYITDDDGKTADISKGITVEKSSIVTVKVQVIGK